tara:strand:- start:866 stop:1261 length:396 start_codon:yes stop_codon:yes gene_type:complete
MQITRNGQIPSMKGPEEWFSGTVRIDPLYPKQKLTKGAGTLVTFEPGARTAWHTHPAGQTIIIQTGLGWVQKEGGPIEEVRPGDVVYFEPEEKHWHGASPEKAMSHIAIQEEVDGEVVTWMEHVSDEQYQK